MDYVVEKEIDGIVYRARFLGMSYALSIMDLVKDEKSQLKLAQRLFNDILVSPKMDIDDFADYYSFLNVHDFLLTVAVGEFSEKEPTSAQIKRKVREQWSLWRLVVSQRGFDFQTVFGKPYMTPQDIREANTALDLQLEAEKKVAKKK